MLLSAPKTQLRPEMEEREREREREREMVLDMGCGVGTNMNQTAGNSGFPSQLLDWASSSLKIWTGPRFLVLGLERI